MKTSSAKQKGRLLQQFVVNQVLSIYNNLTKDDVKSTSSGVTGLDVQLSALAKRTFKYSCECKSREALKGLYAIYDQAVGHDESLEPLVIVKSNRRSPLAIISAEHFFALLKQLNKGN